MSELTGKVVSTAVTKESPHSGKPHIPDPDVPRTIGRNVVSAPLPLGHSVYGKPTASPKPNTGPSTNTKTVIASFAVELTDEGSGYPSITVTQQDLSVDSSVPLATETYWGIYEMTQQLYSGLLLIWTLHQRSKR
jgi:hypothetical protein